MECDKRKADEARRNEDDIVGVLNGLKENEKDGIQFKKRSEEEEFIATGNGRKKMERLLAEGLGKFRSRAGLRASTARPNSGVSYVMSETYQPARTVSYGRSRTTKEVKRQSTKLRGSPTEHARRVRPQASRAHFALCAEALMA